MVEITMPLDSVTSTVFFFFSHSVPKAILEEKEFQEVNTRLCWGDGDLLKSWLQGVAWWVQKEGAIQILILPNDILPLYTQCLQPAIEKVLSTVRRVSNKWKLAPVVEIDLVW